MNLASQLQLQSMKAHLENTLIKMRKASDEGRTHIANWRINSDISDEYVKEELEEQGFVVCRDYINWSYPTSD